MIILINGLQYTDYQDVRLERGRGKRLRRLLGPGAGHRRAQPVAPVLCRAPLWRRARRGNADGAEASASAQGHRRHEGARENGLRYPIAPYGIQSDVRAGMGVSYAKK